MNLTELHQIPNFKALFADERFMAVLSHLRARVPRKPDSSGDWFNGWHDAVDRMESLQNPPVKEPEANVAPRNLYRVTSASESVS